MVISISVLVKASLCDVYLSWNNPEDILVWNAASDDWHTTESEVDLREGGAFRSRMEAKDGSVGFDFSGVYTKVVPESEVCYEIEDGRKVKVTFEETDSGVKVVEEFEAETENSPELQQAGWQAILNNFAKHTEARYT